MNEKLSLLLIEDDPVDQLAFKHMVSSGGLDCTYEVAGSLAESRRLLGARRFDVVVSDNSLPDGKAVDIFEGLQDLVVILVTGSGDEETAIKAMRAGVNDYLVKDSERKYLQALPGRINKAMRESRMAAQLKESEARLRDMFDGTSDLIQSIAADGRILFVNRAWRETLGYSEEELAELNIFELLHPSEKEHCGGIFARLMSGEDVGLLNTTFVSKSGVSVCLEGRVSVRYEDGRPVSTRGIFRDVTERIRKDEQLKLLETCLSKVNDIVMITEAAEMKAPGPRILYVNDAFERITGYSREEVIGQTPRLLQGAATDREELHRVADALRAGKAVSSTLLNYRKDGGTFWNEMTITPVADTSGKLSNWVSIERDATERKQTEARIEQLTSNLEGLVKERTGALVESEKRFRLFSELSADTLWDLDIGTRIVRVWRNAHFRENFRDIGNMSTLEDWQAGIHPDDRTRVIESFESAIASSGTRWQAEYRYLRKDGTYAPVMDRGIMGLDDNGRRSRMVGGITDLTEKKQIEMQFLRSQRLESLGTLSGGVAHDLNNALSPILMGLDMLRAKCPPGTAIIDTMEASARRGAAMVRQLLTFAKGVEGDRVSIQSLHLFREMESIIRGTFPKNITLKTSFPKLQEPVLGDPTQLHQVLLNLCVNARDAMPDGGTLSLSIVNVELDETAAAAIHSAMPGRYVEWQVSDTGTGIPPNVLERIFEPFFTTKAPDKGTGLGLSTVLGIIKSHEGFINVKTEPRKGTTFSVYLPVDTETHGSASIANDADSGEFSGRGETVLLVEDEPSVRDMTAALLRALKFNVLTAKNGADGLILVAERRAEIRLVLTDLHMPHLDGLGFARLLRRMAPDTGVIVASGRMDDETRAEFQSLGVDALLNKPFTKDDLVAALRNALSASRP